MSKLTNAVRLLAIAGLGLAASASYAQDAGQQPAAQGGNQLNPNSWNKICQSREDDRACQTQFMQTASGTGQLVTAVYITETTQGGETSQTIRIVLPPERVLSAGVGVQIDGGQMQRLNYTICPLRPQPFCVAEAPLTPELLNSLKAGGSMKVVSLNPMGQQTPVDITLQGFSAAHDGDPIDIASLQAQENAARQQNAAEIEAWAQRFRDRQGGESAPAQGQ